MSEKAIHAFASKLSYMNDVNLNMEDFDIPYSVTKGGGCGFGCKISNVQ